MNRLNVSTVNILGQPHWMLFCFIYTLLTSASALATPTVELTTSEKIWLENHPQLRLGTVPSWEPISMRDQDSQLVGITGDYKLLLEQRLNIKFALQNEIPWQETLEAARHRQIDLLLPTASTPDRDTYLNFTDVLFDLPYVIITQVSHASVDSELNLKREKIAVAQKYVAHEWLAKEHPEMELIIKADTLKALEAVASGEADAYIGDFASASYLIDQFGISRLKVAGRASLSNRIRIGVRKDWPELIPILNKALATIDSKTKKEIWHRWVGFESFGVDSRIVYGLLFVFVLSIIVILVFANRKLRVAYRSLNELLELRSKEASKIEHMAYYDLLTDLPNRSLFSLRLDTAMSEAKIDRVLAVCYLDIDGFKPINDDYGHEQGDMLLVELAKRLQTLCQPNESVARLGGDEFVLLLTEYNGIDDILSRVIQIMQAIESPFLLQEKIITLTVSMGIAIYPYDSVDADTLLRHADHAMFQAKKSGRNRFELFDADADQRWNAQNELLKDVHRAVVKNEFCLFYQPKVNMQTGVVVGAEALIRWNHPEQGLLSPASFLPAVEQTDIMPLIDEWVLNAALNQINAWLLQGLSLRVSVNISAQSLSNPSFPRILSDCLAQYSAISPSLLSLEVLESSAIADINIVNQIMRECVAVGVSFSLDDFGTGYSSLTYLRRLSASSIKIDQSFIRSMLTNSEDLAIVQGVIALGHAFDLDIIAEGVETAAHGAMLLKLGCNLAQGYGIARPMPEKDVLAWISSYQPSELWINTKQFVLESQDLALIIAEIEHQKWIENIINILHSKQHAIPEDIDEHHCRFGRWHDHSGIESFGHLSSFSRLSVAHHALHELGHELLAQHASAYGSAVYRIPELLVVQKTMLRELHKLQIEIAEAAEYG